MSRILCLPDLHAWYPTYDRGGSRLEEWRRCAGALLGASANPELGIDLVVAPGDLFPNARPSAAQIIEVVRFFAEIEARVPVVACAGNHDYPGDGQRGPVDLLAEVQPRWGVTRPAVKDAGGLQVAVLPWTKPHALGAGAESAGDAVQIASDQLLSVSHSLAAQLDPGRPAILIGHWALEGSELSSGQVLAGGEPALRVADLQTQPWRAVIMGHIHRPQILSTEPPIVHTGALVRHDFGEARDERGAYLIDTETGEIDWIEVPARRFVTVDLDNADLEWIAGGGDPAAPLSVWHDSMPGAIVRVTYQAAEDQAGLVDHGKIIRALEQAGAHLVAGVYPEIARAERTRAEGLDERTGPEEALARWLALRPDLPEETRHRVLGAGRTLLKEVA